MASTYSEDIIDYIKSLRSGGEKNKTEIARRTNEEFGGGFEIENLRKKVKRVVEEDDMYDEIRALSDESSDEKYEEFDREGISYVRLTSKKKDGTRASYEIPLDSIDEIQYLYSKNGKNLSRAKIAKELGIKFHAINTIMNAFNIYKDSDIVSDIKIKKMEEEGVVIEDYIDSRVEGAIADKYKEKYKESWDHQIEKQGLKAMKRMGKIEGVIDFIMEKASKYPIEPYKPVKKLKIRPILYSMYTITDLHLGKENTLGILKRLDRIKADILNDGHKYSIVEILGDLGEIFVEGGRHPGQIEEMEGPYGFDLLMMCVDTIATFLNDIGKKKKLKVICIGGNHDVFSVAKGGDDQRTAALCIYHMIKERLQNNKNIEIVIPRDWVYTYKTGSINNIIAHGDIMAKKKLADIILEYGDLNCFNLVKYGHLHYTNLRDISKSGMCMGVPGLAGKGKYDEKLMLSSTEGYVSMIENPYSETGMPKISFNLL